MAAPKGNQYGRKPKVWTSSLKRAIARYGEGDWRKGLDQLADKMVKAADKGDQWALNHIAERIEGKATENVNVNQNINVQVGNARTLANTLRALEQPTESAVPTVQ